MVACKGVVRDDVVVLENGSPFPNGAVVEVRLMETPLTREEAFVRLLANRIDRSVGMAEIIEEEKQAREEHPDSWLQPS